MIKYLKELIAYYKKFGLTTNIHNIEINNLNGNITVIKHPSNRITKNDILRTIKFNPVPKETFEIISNIRKVSNDK